MKSHSVVSVLIALLVASVVPAAAQNSAQQGARPFFEPGQVTSLGERADGTTRLRIDFEAFTDSTKRDEFNGNITIADINRRLNIQGEPVKEFLAPPMRGAGADTIPLAFVLAIDVSQSMGPYSGGGAGGNYERRMKVVKSAVSSFLRGIRGQKHVYIQIVPFGHEVPQPVEIANSSQDIAAWSGRFVRMDEGGYRDLRQAIDDLDTFVYNNSAPVETALYGAIDEGVQTLRELGGSQDPELRRARKVLIVLTDGQNDLGTFAGSQYGTVTVQNVRDVVMNPVSPSVYVIGFGEDIPRSAERELESIRDASSKSHLLRVRGAGAATALKDEYDKIFEVEGSKWYVEVAADIGSRDPVVAIDNRYLPSFSMLLLPTALAEQTLSGRLITAGVAAALVVIFFNVWYFTRPKIEDTLDLEGVASAADLDEIEEGDIEPAKQAGISVQEYMRQKRGDAE